MCTECPQNNAPSLNARKSKKTITSTSTLDWFDSSDSNLKNDVVFVTISLLLAELCLRNYFVLMADTCRFLSLKYAVCLVLHDCLRIRLLVKNVKI